jgi:hypothetical protein
MSRVLRNILLHYQWSKAVQGRSLQLRRNMAKRLSHYTMHAETGYYSERPPKRVTKVTRYTRIAEEFLAAVARGEHQKNIVPDLAKRFNVSVRTVGTAIAPHSKRRRRSSKPRPVSKKHHTGKKH